MLYADSVLINGNIITMNHEQPKVQAIAIKHGRFVAVGTNEQIQLHAGRNTERIDLNGKTVVPGLIDTHVHGAALGRETLQLDVRSAKTIKEITQKVKQWAGKVSDDEWIVGHGWDQDRLTEHRYPSRFELDQAAPNNPVILVRVCRHVGVANSRALTLAKITKKTEPPEGGRIDIDHRTGEPNGILRENALELIYKILPIPTEEKLAEICLSACQKMVEKGITTAHWIISSMREMRTLQRLKNQKALPLRIYALIPVEYLDQLADMGLTTGFGDNRIKIGGVKILTDGSLGARTAALKQPYNDAPNNKGMLLYSQKQLERLVKKAHEADMQLAIHAIGDRAIEVVLKTLEQVLEKTPRKKSRHRLEHVSVLDFQSIKKMKKLGIVASIQPHFIVSDFWVTNRLGEARARWTYAFKSQIKNRVVTTGSSDAPIESVSPILGIYAAVARETFPEERLTVDEALRLYTASAAYGSLEENVKGSIENGKLADLTVLSQDPYKTNPNQIKAIKVEMTIVGGRVVYTRKR